MTVAAALAHARMAAAQIAQAARGLDVTLLQSRLDEHDSALALLIEAAKTEQAAACLAMLPTVRERAGRA